MKHKKAAFEDSLHSTRAAIEEGIVPGGGVALLNASQVISTLKLDREEMIGAQIVRKACEAPLRQIVLNAGQDPSVVVDMLARSPKNYGFNAAQDVTDEIRVEDLIALGITDPAKVEKAVLTYAVSAAGMFFLSRVVIADEDEE